MRRYGVSSRGGPYRSLALAAALAACRPAAPPPAPPPPGAAVLFDGRSLDGWTARDGAPPRWRLAGGAMRVVPGTGDLVSTARFGDAIVHVEFRLPSMPGETGQRRANSGVFLHGRYEVQVLDMLGNTTEPERGCGALYGVAAPRPPAACRPGVWHRFDVDFRAPRTGAAGVVTTAGTITVLHDGVTVLDHARFDGPTGKMSLLGSDVPAEGPLLLQDHGAPVEFRNVWIVRN
jgi:hypothetical protein